MILNVKMDLGILLKGRIYYLVKIIVFLMWSLQCEPVLNGILFNLFAFKLF